MNRYRPEPDRDDVLVVEGLRKTYGELVAVNDVAFSVQSGTVVGLIGANGAGKTTTMSCIAGLRKADAGKITVCGLMVPDDQQLIGRVLGLSGQETALYPELTGRVNLRFFGELAGFTAADVDASIDDLSARLCLGPHLDRRVRDLSGGQRQLVHVAACLVHRPRLVLLDEPSTGLDPKARRDLLATIRWLAASGAAVMFSSHRLSEVEEVCDQVVLLHKGHVLAAAPLGEVIAAHGEAHVEIRRAGRTERLPGVDVAMALATIDDLSAIEAVTVTQPSLETVFFALTGIGIDGGSPDASDVDHSQA